jgi:hypothetical protein
VVVDGVVVDGVVVDGVVVDGVVVDGVRLASTSWVLISRDVVVWCGWFVRNVLYLLWLLSWCLL